MLIPDLPPNIFSIVMATGIVSLAALGHGWGVIAWCLFAVSNVAYAALWCCLIARWFRYRDRMLADYANHAKAPGYFTLVAGTCVLGNQYLLVVNQLLPALGLWLLGLALWCLLTYTMLPVLMSAEHKPHLEHAIGGAWLLAVVGTQSVSILASLLVQSMDANWSPPGLFLALTFWLVGSMLYMWLISLIFYRIVFLPLPPRDLAPPYWINMGAMAISTLAGVWLVRGSDRLPLLGDLLPFLKGLTLMFWATATWWIPLLLMLGAWRHLRRHFPLTYEHGYWSAVFPLGMYTVCTQRLIDSFNLPFLQPIATGFAWISIGAWLATFLGLSHAMSRALNAAR
jgi:tellurite resistance protein TehA-like permease